MGYREKYGSNCGSCYFLFEKKIVKRIPNVTYWPIHRQAGALMINI